MRRWIVVGWSVELSIAAMANSQLYIYADGVSDVACCADSIPDPTPRHVKESHPPCTSIPLRALMLVASRLATEMAAAVRSSRSRRTTQL